MGSGVSSRPDGFKNDPRGTGFPDNALEEVGDDEADIEQTLNTVGNNNNDDSMSRGSFSERYGGDHSTMGTDSVDESRGERKNEEDDFNFAYDLPMSQMSTGTLEGSSSLRNRKGEKYYSTGLSAHLKRSMMADMDYMDEDSSSAGNSMGTGKRSKAGKIAAHFVMDHFLIERSRVTVASMFMQELQPVSFKSGDILCEQGDAEGALYILEKGVLQFIIDGVVAGTMQTKGLFGELSLVYEKPQVATVECITDCNLWCLKQEGFRRVQGILAMESLSNTYATTQKTLASLNKDFDVTKAQPKDQSKYREKDFEEVELLQEGSFGRVAVVRHENSGKEFIMKVQVRNADANATADRNDLAENKCINEVNALIACESPFVVKVHASFERDRIHSVLLEYCVHGDLMDVMVALGTLPHNTCIFYCGCICEALSKVHSMSFVHRDLKPENCLISRSGYLKLADFGFAKKLPAIVNLGNGRTEISTLAFTMCGTPEFMAPEFCLSTGYDRSCDWWALGCIVYEMFMGRNPFDFDGDLSQTFKEICLIGMKKRQIGIHAQFRKMFPVAASIIKGLLSPVDIRLGKDRDIWGHEFLKDLDRNSLRRRELEAPTVTKKLTKKEES